MTGATPPPPPPGGMPPSSPPPGGSLPPGAPPPPPPGAMPPMSPGAPGFGNQVQPGGTNGMAIASLVLGIISVPLCFLFIPAILAVVFGLIALSQIKNNLGQGGRGQAIAGLILGGISLAIIIVLFVAVGTAEFQFESPFLLN